MQTILPTLLPASGPDLRKQRIELDDGDFIDLGWCEVPGAERVLVLLHGLEGGADSPYVMRLMRACQELGVTTVLHHHRSCSGEPNRLARSYHSGESADFRVSLAAVQQAMPDAEVMAVGYSLGGNVLAKHLGETGEDSGISKAVVVSAPLQLRACAKRLEYGFSKVYQRHLIKRLVAKTEEKIQRPSLKGTMPLDRDALLQLKTFHAFDDAVTAPLHGFDDVYDYYRRSSGLQFLKAISTPTLIMHAIDDPFMTDEVVPHEKELSDQITYELYPRGGHVGFIDGGTPWKPQFMLETRVLGFLGIH